MALTTEQPNDKFAEAEDKFDWPRLVKALEAEKGDKIRPKAQEYLKAVLCGYEPQEIAQRCGVTRKAVEVELNREVKPYLILILKLSEETRINWSRIPRLLGDAGFNHIQKLFLAPPKPTYNLVGRDDLLHDLKQRLCAGGCLALSALNGLPGVGKTALAIELAYDSEVLEHFPDGILWAGLGRKPDVLALLGTWGTALGIPQAEMAKLSAIQNREKAIEEVVKTIHFAIGTRRMLLVVDDAWDSEAALAFRLRSPNCTHLLTTRLINVALDFAGEGATSIAELSEEDGLTLLARFAPKAVEAEQDEAKALVEAVGGLPLALTLIGKYLQKEAYSGQPRRIRAALNRLKHFEERLLLTQPQAPSERHTSLPTGTPLSLQAVIEVSDDSLDETASHTLYALSVFPPKPNTFSEEAALAVCAVPVQMIDTLYDSGLLESSGGNRYTLHQTIADYARLKLLDQSAYERMVEFFVGYVETHETDYISLDLEIGNILAALQVGFERGMQATLLRGANALYRFWDIRGLYAVGEIHLNRAKQAAQSLGAEVELGKTLLYLGRIAEKRGYYELAKKYCQEGLVLARRIQDRELISALLVGLGVEASYSGNYAEAEKYLHEGLTVAREIEHYERIIVLLRNLGALAGNRGDYQQAEIYYQDGLTLARKVENKQETSGILQGLGWIAHNSGNYPQAEVYYQDGLALAYEIGHRERISVLLMNIGCVADECGDYSKAEEYYKKALILARQIGNRERIGSSLDNLGYVTMKSGNYKQAEEFLQEALALAREINYPWLISSILKKQGELHLKQQNFKLAAETFSESLSIARNIGVQKFIGDALYGLSQVEFAQGNAIKARDLGQESLATYNAIPYHKHKAAEVKQWLACIE